MDYFHTKNFLAYQCFLPCDWEEGYLTLKEVLDRGVMTYFVNDTFVVSLFKEIMAYCAAERLQKDVFNKL